MVPTLPVAAKAARAENDQTRSRERAVRTPGEVDLGPGPAEIWSCRPWLIAANAPVGFRGLALRSEPDVENAACDRRRTGAAQFSVYQTWGKRLLDTRPAYAHNPRAYAGGLSVPEMIGLKEELTGAPVPRARGAGERLRGQTLGIHGAPDQRAYFLPRIVHNQDA
jgi:hypothetical protein